MSEAQHPLLTVQEHDTSLDHLRHERAALPERDIIAEAEKRTTQVEKKRSQVHEQLSVVASEQKRREDEVATLESKIVSENDKLYGGSITSPKEAQAIQEELAALARHLDHLETQLLEVMDRREPLDAEEAELDATLAELSATIASAQTALASAEADIDAKLAAAQTARDGAEAAVDPDLLAKYNSMRSGFGASAVVTFDGKNCVGCPMMMPAVVLDLMKKAEAHTVQDCSECGRLVVK